jgi:serum/glucocorticoid-regulated kinase 2
MATGDYVGAEKSPIISKMLAKHGQNVPDKEVIHFCDFVVKINRKKKEQQRVMLITSKAVYNLMPKDHGKCKRRIALLAMIAITASATSDEFVVHVPDEYDYHFKCQRKLEICKILGQLYAAACQAMGGPGTNGNTKLNTTVINQTHLHERALTKAMARMQTREDILRRKQEFMAVEDTAPQDVNFGAEESKEQMTSMMGEGAERVRLDDFELLKVLGRGSFGKVMQVRKKTTGVVYAMKILKKAALAARNQVDHTKAERKILQALQHPFLMTLRYAFQSKEKLYFVLDYYQGGELFFHLKNQRRFPEEVGRLYTGEIGLALGHLHSLGVIYRDLKPENVILDSDGHVCLTDFGLSKEMEPDNKAHTFCGTPEYLAPEIVAGTGHDKAVDWWALGILLYELTVGIPPFYSQQVSEMYQKIQTGVLRFPPDLSEQCKALIVALLNRDPKKRLCSRDDVEELKAHPFFATINWRDLYDKKIVPPFKPKVKGKDDTNNFDSAFTSEPVVDSVIAQSQLAAVNEAADAFPEFTYNPKGELG